MPCAKATLEKIYYKTVIPSVLYGMVAWAWNSLPYTIKQIQNPLSFKRKR